MKKKIEDLKRYGHFELNGREYVLTEQAEFQSDPISTIDDWDFDNYYSARAICPGDEVDEDGYQKCYMLRWEILDSYDPDLDGEDEACDWGTPSGVKEHGEYSLEEDFHY